MKTTDEYEQRTFAQRYGFALGVGGLVVVAALVFGGQLFSSKHGGPSRKAPEVTMVKITSLPPPPPPPPPPPSVQEQKMLTQAPVDDQEQKPDDKPAPAAPALGTNIKGDGGPDGFGLSGSGAGGAGIGEGQRRGSGTRWGWYAAQVQRTLGDALRQHPRTRNASFVVEVRLWPDLTGYIRRAQLVTSTGDRAMDAALRSEVLTGLRLQEPPPAGLPLPIVLRLTARRPN